MTEMRETDPLRPTEEAATEAWASRVLAERAQVDRCREQDDSADCYELHAKRFAQDPRRTDDPALEVLLAMVEQEETWLDLGAGGGRYTLPLALQAGLVHAVDPSPSMLRVLREGMAEHGIENVDITEGQWPLPRGEAPTGEVALMAHVGYGIEAFGTFLDAAEAAVTRRCVVVMRAALQRTSTEVLWQEIHGEPRARLPMLPELLVLLTARGVTPEVLIRPRVMWGYESLDSLLEGSRQMLLLRPGSPKEVRMQGLVRARASERDGTWALDWSAVPDGIVSWEPRRRPTPA